MNDFFVDLNLVRFLNGFGISLNQYDICGFKNGVFEAIKSALNAKTRINRLILLSPDIYFCEDNLREIQDKGIKIIVFLDAKDEDFMKILEFFKKFAIVYCIKEVDNLFKDRK